MNWSTEELYRLLPEILRLRDLEQGRLTKGVGPIPPGDNRDAENYAPIKTLMSLLAREFRCIEDDIDALYDDHFIETCAAWVIPYLADLLGEGRLVDTDGSLNQRARVADALPLRQRKGTIKALEHAASSASGWPIAGREFRRHLVVGRSMRHAGAHTGGSLNVRHLRPGEEIDDPFTTHAHGGEVGLIRPGHGRFNLPNVGLSAWRLQPMSATNWPVQPIAAGRRDYRFHPLGIDAPLFSCAPRGPDLSERTGPEHVPRAISRPRLADHAHAIFGSGLSIDLTIGGSSIPVGRMRACHLGDRGDPPAAGQPRPWNRTAPPDEILIDPVLGRLTVGSNLDGAVRVSCHHGFPGLIAGGEYDRDHAIGALSAPFDASPGDDLSGIINGQADRIDIMLAESGVYHWNGDVSLAGGRRVRVLVADGRLAVVHLDGEHRISLGNGAEFELGGAMVAGGGFRFLGNSGNTRARFVDCTFVPGWELEADRTPIRSDQPSLRFNGNGMSARLERTICGPILMTSDVDLLVENSVVDAIDPSAAAIRRNANATGDVATFVASTVVGRVDITAFGGIPYEAVAGALPGRDEMGLPATSDTLFFAAPSGLREPVRAERRQSGCLRFCFVPDGSLTPRRHRCLAGGIAESWFVSRKYGDAAYLQLHCRRGALLAEAASNGDEIGVWNHLKNSARRSNIRRAIEGFLRYGMEAGVEFET
jgi:hypothetical protein